MATSQTDINLKKLMKIIYQKEKEVEKYRRQLREKQKSKLLSNQSEHTISQQEKQLIKKQIHENQKFIETAGIKMNQMEIKIMSLQDQLAEQEYRNSQLQEQIRQLKQKNNENILKIGNYEIEKQLYKAHQAKMNEKIKMFSQQIQTLQDENFRSSKMNEIILVQRNQIVEKLANTEYLISKNIHQISKSLRKLGSLNSKKKILGVGSSIMLQPRSEFKIQSACVIESDNAIDNAEKRQKSINTTNCLQKCEKLINLLRAWQEALANCQQQLRDKFERQLNQNSILGISKLIEESEIQDSPAEPIYQPSPSFLQNQEDLLKRLEEQCNKSENYSIDKQKLIELSQIKQSLKMTKQVNAQLFDELGHKESEMRQMKKTLSNLQSQLKQYQFSGRKFQKDKPFTVLGAKN